MKIAKCIDCGIEYRKFGLDYVFPDQQWKIICPENGILCGNCIAKRVEKLKLPSVIMCWIDRVDYSKPFLNNKNNKQKQ